MIAPSSGHGRPLRRITLAALALAAMAALSTPDGRAAGVSEEAEHFYEEALRHLEAGRGRAAIIELRNALQRDPKSAKARLLLGKIRLASGDPEAAEKELRLALAAQYTDETEILLGRALVDQLKFEDVVRTVSRDAFTEEAVQEKLMVLADAYWGLKQLDEVDNIYSQILDTWPSNKDARLGNARLHLARNQRSTAERLTDEVLADHPDFGDAWVLQADLAILDRNTNRALNALEQALIINPENVNAMTERARLNLILGNWEQVEADVEVARRLQRSNPYVLFLRASLRFVQGNYIWADGDFAELERKLSEEPPVLLLGTLIKFSLGDYAQSERLLSRYLSKRPRSTAAQRVLGLILIKRDNAVTAMSVLEPLVAEHPEDSAALHLLATAYLQLGRHGAASRMLQRILQQGRSEADDMARRGLIELAEGAGIGNWEPPQEERIIPASLSEEIFPIVDFLEAGNLEEARARVRTLKARYPDNPFILSIEGIVLFERGNAEAARASFERALSFEPEFLFALDNFDRLDQYEGRTGDIETRLRELLLRRPRSDSLILRMANLLARTKGAQVAIEFLEEKRIEYVESVPVARRLVAAHLSAGSTGRPLQILEELMITHAESVNTLTYVRSIFEGLGQHEEAIEVSRRLMVIEPLEIGHQLNLANSLILAGRPEEAQEVLQEAKEMAPDNADVVRNLIGMALERGDVEGAIQQAEEIRTYDKVMSRGLHAHILLKNGDIPGAIKILEETYATNPVSPIAIDLFFARRKAGDKEAAVAGLLDHLQKVPKDRSVRHAVASTLIEVGRLDEAMAQYQRLVDGYSGDALALNNLAWLRNELGYKDSLDIAKRAYQIAPNAGQIADTYGWLLVQANQLEEGVVVLRHAVGQAPTDPNVRYRLAYALNKAGQGSEAKQVLETILASNESFSERTKAEALMKSLGQ